MVLHFKRTHILTDISPYQSTISFGLTSASTTSLVAPTYINWANYHSPTHLADPAIIPQQPQDLIQEWSLRNVTLVTATTEDTIKFMVKRKPLANSSMCGACNRLRTIHQDPEKTDVIWECPNHQCRNKKSICEGSFSCKSQLSLVQLLTFIFCRAEEFPLFQYNKESGGIHTNTLGCDVQKCVRGLAASALLSNWRPYC